MARPKSVIQVEIPPIISAELGAGACLKFLQEQEANAREPIQTAKGALDALLRARASRDARFDGKDDKEWDQDIRAAETRLDIATTDHGKASERLLKYEKAVAPEKRGDGERVTQEEVAKWLTNFAVHWRFGWKQALALLCQQAPMCKTAIDAQEIFEPILDDCLITQFEAAVIDGKIPQWAADATKEGT